MAQLISEIWEGLRAAGMPEVMLYLPDLTASRCHWKDTTLIGETRVALLADQDRQIVRILPVDSCVGIGIASPKGVDPSGYKTVVYSKLASQFGGEIPPTAAELEAAAEAAAEAEAAEAARLQEEAAPDVQAAAPTPPPEPEPAKPDPAPTRWGSAPKQPPTGIRPAGASNAFMARR